MIERIDFNIAAETKLTADVVFFRNMPSNVLVDVSMCDWCILKKSFSSIKSSLLFVLVSNC